MTSDFQRRGPVSRRPGTLPSLLCFPRVGAEFGSHSFGQSCGVPPLSGLVLEGLAWSTPSPSPCLQGTRLAALTPRPLSCAGVLYWSSPAGRASRGHLRAGGCCPVCQERPRFHPGPVAAPPFCLLGGSSRPGHPLPPGTEWHFLPVQLGGSPLQGLSGGPCISSSGCRPGCLCPTVCPWCPRAWLQDPAPPCPSQPPALPTESSRFCM